MVGRQGDGVRVGWQRVVGRTIDFRLVEPDDAAFILELRLDLRASRFLSPTPPGLDGQRQWLAAYKERERQGLEYYYIIESKQRVPCGTMRLYDFREDSFMWGSWIIRPGSPARVSVESLLVMYRHGFEDLGFPESRFEVRKDNARVVAFHHRFGAKLLGEDDRTYFFGFSRTDFPAAWERYGR